MIESLESRSMLTITVDGTDLVIEGSEANDNLLVRTVRFKGVDSIEVRMQGARETFELSTIDRLLVELGPGNDSGQLSSNFDVPAKMLGQGGSDTLTGGAASDTLVGGKGADELSGGNGEDTLRGGRGPDSLDGGEGTDVEKGGPGKDTVPAAAALTMSAASDDKVCTIDAVEELLFSE